MLTRLTGLVLIGNTLIPALAAIAVAATFLHYKDDVERGWREIEGPLIVVRDSAEQSAETALDAASNAMAKLGLAMNGFEALGNELNAVHKTVEPTLSTIRGISLQSAEIRRWRHAKICPDVRGVPACVPIVSTTEITLGADLAKPFYSVFNAMQSAAQPVLDLKAAMVELGIVDELSEEARRAQAALGIASRQAIAIAGPLGNMLVAIGYVAIFLLVWFALQFVVRGTAQVALGWRMLTTGRQPTTP